MNWKWRSIDRSVNNQVPFIIIASHRRLQDRMVDGGGVPVKVVNQQQHPAWWLGSGLDGRGWDNNNNERSRHSIRQVPKAQQIAAVVYEETCTGGG